MKHVNFWSENLWVRIEFTRPYRLCPVACEGAKNSYRNYHTELHRETKLGHRNQRNMQNLVPLCPGYRNNLAGFVQSQINICGQLALVIVCLFDTKPLRLWCLHLCKRQQQRLSRELVWLPSLIQWSCVRPINLSHLIWPRPQSVWRIASCILEWLSRAIE